MKAHRNAAVLVLSLIGLVLTAAMTDTGGAELFGFIAVGVVGVAAVGALVAVARRED
ncbi:MAG: hypothetical protein KDB26_12420 [Microthrixaceae bacterium]|nr:hypothetical protein [Microthrixaceae bacterium]